MKAPGGDPTGRLVSTMLDVVVAEMAEPGRLRRGHTYAKQGAVVELDVLPGIVLGAVQGSERQPYQVEVRAPIVPDEGRKATALVPTRRELRTSCSCPDDFMPCKHAVAVLSELSTRVAYDPSLFLHWRTGADRPGSPAGPDAPSRSTSDAPRGDRGRRLPAPPPGPAPEVLAAIAAHLGDDLPAPPPPPALTDLAGPRTGWDDVAARMLTDALTVLRGR